MLAHTLRRYAATAITISALAISTTACGGDDPEAAPTDGPTSTATSSTSEPTTEPTPTTDPDAWRTKYSPAQLEAYDTALQRWESYESRSEPIWAKGEATPAAEKLFKEYFPHPTWMSYWELLQTYEQVHVKADGTPGVFWSMAKSISKSGRSVQIKQCVDYTAVHGTQNGKPTVRSPWMEKPQLRTIYLTQADGYDWLIYGVVDASDGKKRPCTP